MLEYTYDKPEAILPPAEQLQTYCALLQAFDATCCDQPEAVDETLREYVLNRVPGARLWQRLYAKTFATTMRRAVTAIDEAALDTDRKAIMVFLVERAKGVGTDEDKAARAQQAALRLTLRAARPEDQQEANAATRLTVAAAGGKAAPPPELAAALESLTPLRREELGPCSVRQKPGK